MIIRTLKENEYEKLKSAPWGELLTPENSIVVVMENGDGKITGRMALMNLIHLGGAWLEESSWSLNYGLSLLKLEEAVISEAREVGLKQVHTYAPSLMHEDLLQRSGWQRLPLSVWVKNL